MRPEVCDRFGEYIADGIEAVVAAVALVALALLFVLLSPLALLGWVVSHWQGDAE